MSRPVRAVAVPVPGGDLQVGVWDARDAGGGQDAVDERGRQDRGRQGQAAHEDAAPTILAIHGVTSSHLAWELLADELPDVRIVAPDLRGRGRSNELVGSAGMARHADDLAAVSAALGLGPVVVVAHSMGAFVAMAFAARHPELVSRLVLVDGGLPLDAPAGLDADALVAAILGPTAARLTLRFDSTEDYLDFWRSHPAFQDDWSPALERYLAYDLVPEAAEGAAAGSAEPPRLRPATSYATTVEDTIDMNTTTTVVDAVAALDRPATLVTVPRGLQNEEPGLYAEPYLEGLLAAHPAIAHERWPEFNHYTVVLSVAGAERLAGLVRAELAVTAAAG